MMKCEICNKDQTRGEILKLKKREIFVCRDCQSYAIFDGLHLQGGVMIVPVKSSSLEKALNEKIYIRPWRKKAKHAPFLAFYYQGTVSYVGKVKHIQLKVAKENLAEFLPKNEEWGKKEYYTIYTLAYVDSLKDPIVRGKCPTIQSKRMVSFKRFAKAKSICDLI